MQKELKKGSRHDQELASKCPGALTYSQSADKASRGGC
jgi:hypothetical protein